jgi:biotin carboxyl carrier protein
MELAQIEELAVLLREHPISEIEVSRQGSRIHLKKGAAVAMTAAPTVVDASFSTASADEMATAEPSTAAVDNSVLLSSELVGIFHHAVPPVRVGATIQEGQTVGNVESMKLMNEVRSEVGGQVAEVLIEEGEPVDYGRLLFRIVPK